MGRRCAKERFIKERVIKEGRFQSWRGCHRWWCHWLWRTTKRLHHDHRSLPCSNNNSSEEPGSLACHRYQHVRLNAAPDRLGIVRTISTYISHPRPCRQSKMSQGRDHVLVGTDVSRPLGNRTRWGKRTWFNTCWHCEWRPGRDESVPTEHWSRPANIVDDEMLSQFLWAIVLLQD